MNPETVIDLHCHAAGFGAGGSGCRVSARLRRSWKFRFYLRAFGVTEAELEREGDMLVLRRLAEGLAQAQLVDQAVILALDCVVDSAGRPSPDASELYIPNDFIAQACRRHDNLLFGASVNPYRRDALEQLDSVAAAGAVLLKWLPSIQGIDPADQRLRPFYRRLAALRLPLLCHTGEEESFTRADNTLADPERLRNALEEGVTVIAAHCASNGRNQGEHNFPRFLRLASAYPNLHADISALTQINRLGHLQKVLARPELHDRLHFGTDMPLPCTGLTSPWFQLGRLPFAEIRRLAAIRNPWDQSLRLKQALGLPQSVLTNTARLLRRP
ncbi:MAG: metal-dependent hydrolase [Desulfuromonadales bacterium GWC2_61_20]|nr:MAG: metal-dependent hydrolase [Desulfuromonadales bacterium GWC2_61_20]HAD04184.1 metal-dependent hydrolase [Desulfuromonas sp.]